MEPLLSVITPVYNVEAYLNRCVESILAQSYSHVELIVVDDGSTDGSGRLCDRWAAKDSRVRVIHKENGGVSSARNEGLKMATGQYLTFVDPDDYLAPDTYAANMEYLLRHQEIDMLQYPYIEVAAGGKMIREHRPKVAVLTGARQIFANWWSGSPLNYSICNKIFRRDLWHDILFRVGHVSEDTMLVAIFVNRAQSVFISSQGLYYYQRDRVDSYTFGEYDFDKHLDLFYAHSAIYDCFHQFPDMKNEKVLAFTRLFRRLITAKSVSPESDITVPLGIINEGYPTWRELLATQGTEKLWLMSGKILGPRLFTALFLQYLRLSSRL